MKLDTYVDSISHNFVSDAYVHLHCNILEVRLELLCLLSCGELRMVLVVLALLVWPIFLQCAADHIQDIRTRTTTVHAI